MAHLRKIKIDALNEVHQIRKKMAGYSSERIQELAMKAEREMRKLKKHPE